MSSLLGTYRRKMRCGRVTVPSELRRLMPDEVIVFAHPDGCLFLLDDAGLGAAVRECTGDDDDGQRVRRAVGACSMRAFLDVSGALRIPAALRSVVEDDSGEVVFIGSLTHVEIWSPSAWNEQGLALPTKG